MDVAKFDGVYQYGSDWVNEKECRQDGVAVQRRIRKLDPTSNAYIPMFDDEYKGVRNFLDAHFVKNFGWMLDELNEEEGDQTFIRKR